MDFFGTAGRTAAGADGHAAEALGHLDDGETARAQVQATLANAAALDRIAAAIERLAGAVGSLPG
ncbi:hypothetical protein [Amycolatopsis sp. PS_44_ISF1]|uniref:hypothetical protein n=1 Tax=Amycolatopsis sp. PS_44_ISF1 TaxID=2974917 RepID=UPI0028DDB95F|nr:hypothetical protein [Amycolatopsis sp. PS_44_ISF1]MDT8916246.1 hypothetical protein [Amycolatopsis sp. PS_44_ISF1]